MDPFGGKRFNIVFIFSLQYVCWFLSTKLSFSPNYNKGNIGFKIKPVKRVFVNKKHAMCFKGATLKYGQQFSLNVSFSTWCT